MKIKITEVSPRDGLQNESKILSTEEKLIFITKLMDSGLEHIEVTSFVRKDRIPQLSDSQELSHLLSEKIKSRSSVLVPNLIGYENALKNGYKEIAVFTSASETFTKKNINMSIKESIKSFEEISKKAILDGVRVRAYISTVIYCPYEGYINPSKVLETIQLLENILPYEISLGDTIGAGVPIETEKLLSVLLNKYPSKLFAGHFHDTYGMALANVSKSIELGVRSFDSSSGGLGGCPYAKGASGNLATEDLLYFLNKSGYETGISIEKILSASNYIRTILNKEISSKTFQALSSKIGEN
jgi:hydroxymethylglutaryl-CoA lyase